MAGRVAGKVAFITGAARGQGRAHAIRLAEEGADIIAIDICRDYDTVGYPMGTEPELAETVKAVEALDRRIVATVSTLWGISITALRGWHGVPGILGWREPCGSRDRHPGRYRIRRCAGRCPREYLLELRRVFRL